MFYFHGMQKVGEALGREGGGHLSESLAGAILPPMLVFAFIVLLLALLFPGMMRGCTTVIFILLLIFAAGMLGVMQG